MSSHYQIRVEEIDESSGVVLRVGFGPVPANNDVIVPEVDLLMLELKSSGRLPGGELIKINGPSSLPVMAVLIHHLVHLYNAVAIYDPKMSQYVVVSSHAGRLKLGSTLD